MSNLSNNKIIKRIAIIILVICGLGVSSCDDSNITGYLTPICHLSMDTDNGIIRADRNGLSYSVQLFFPSFAATYEIFNDIEGSKYRPWSIEEISCGKWTWKKGNDNDILHNMGIVELHQKSVYQYTLELAPLTDGEIKVFTVSIKTSDGKIIKVYWPQFPPGSEVDEYFKQGNYTGLPEQFIQWTETSNLLSAENF